MFQALIIYPHQLFAEHPGLAKGRPVILYEEPLFFADHAYPARMHKKKLVLHRASMKAYAAELAGRGYDVSYVDYAVEPGMDGLFSALADKGATGIVAADPVDYMAKKRLEREAGRRGLGVRFLESPGFLCPEPEFREFFKDQSGYRQTSFYIHERKRLGVMLDAGGKPRGGKWSFDADNRKPMREGLQIPDPPRAEPGPEVAEAAEYVNRRFAGHPGSTDGFNWPVTRDQALTWLDDFCEHRLAGFGNYQDAIAADNGTLFHCLLSSSINAGLLTPGEVVKAVDRAGREKRLPLNTREGFIRQVLGWREFIRAVYVLEGVTQRKANFFGCGRPMPRAFYDAATGIAPVDAAIARVLDTGYTHHIERLMILGNFMLLCEIEPTAVYTWFTELFMDAYDWVMVPNVYGMSQFADGGLLATKPYVSSSNYVLKMSDHQKGDWCAVWDGLFWRFLHKHAEFFTTNPRTKLMASHLSRMGDKALEDHIRRAEAFLQRLD